mgnify:CR=1 FL=1
MASDSEASSQKNADVMMGRNTDGTFFIRIESDAGSTEVELTPESYAKASIGMMVKGSLTT